MLGRQHGHGRPLGPLQLILPREQDCNKPLDFTDKSGRVGITTATPFLLALAVLASALIIVGRKDRDPIALAAGIGLLALVAWSVLVP